MKIIFTPSRKQFAVRCLLRNTLRPVLAFVLSLIVMPLMAQNNLTVKGRITDENNQPISRVTVALKGTAIGTTTNENGEFSIAAPSNGTLVITSVGYPAREVSIDGQETHNISLTALATGLEQVVVHKEKRT